MDKMDSYKKEALKAAKEITGKFIEKGSLSAGGFADVFPEIYRVVLRAVSEEGASPDSAPDGGETDKAPASRKGR
jgi:hypothetical protein